MQKCTERALHCSYAALSQFFFCYFTLRAAHNNNNGQILSRYAWEDQKYMANLRPDHKRKLLINFHLFVI